MRFSNILSKNFYNNHFYLHTLLFLTQWLTFHIQNSSGELNFALQNDTLGCKDVHQDENDVKIMSLKTQYTKKISRHLPIAINRKLQHSKNDVKKTLKFLYYKNGKPILQISPKIESIYQSNLQVINTCISEKISLIFHGWTESCHTEWIPQLIEKLTVHRGGCIICVDYSSWSKRSYIELLTKFDTISEILYEEVFQLIQIGFNPRKIFMFGFSYGGQVASKIGRLLKPQYRIKKIDICDMAGPGFDFLSYLNHSEAAENIQCYYSSFDKGSHFHSCHQNIRLGQCGYTQPAVVSQQYFSSHGLCVRIYINAFDFPFYAFQRSPRWCDRGNTITNIPNGFTVGYREDGYNDMTGDIFVPTTLNYPYNLSKKEMIAYEKYLEGSWQGEFKYQVVLPPHKVQQLKSESSKPDLGFLWPNKRHKQQQQDVCVNIKKCLIFTQKC